ncbi:MAG: hypothetical protein U0234_18355 [Sandaracinus sp.]
MKDEARLRLGTRLAIALLVVALLACAIVPGLAWAPGSRGLDGAPSLERRRTLSTETGLAAAPDGAGTVMISTGDGGGAGRIEGLDDAPLRIRRGRYRESDGWEIGTAPGRPATFVDDNGIRLDDGMGDRLRERAWPAPAVVGALGVVAILLARRKPEPAAPPWAGAVLFALAAVLAIASLMRGGA